MCRFILYLGRPITLDVLITRPSNSIIHQSFQSVLRSEPLNGDGFGVAWYERELSPEPATFRSIQPAWNDTNLLELARVCRSPAVLAHVRAATAGSSVSQANCHPFAVGRFAFMHNGVVANFAQHKRSIAARLSDIAYTRIQGTTDSELLFGLFCDHHAALQADDETEAIAMALEKTIEEIVALNSAGNPQQASHLNLVVCDGTRAVVSRYSTEGESPSLFMARGSECVCRSGVCRLISTRACDSSIIVASEPLNDDPHWDSVPHNHLLIISPDRSVDFRPLR